MLPTPIQTTSSAVKRPRGGSGSSGRNRPGTRARLESRFGFNDTSTGSTRQKTLSSNEFPPLSFGLQDGYVFDTAPTASDVGGGMMVTGILARPADVGASPSTAATRDGIDMGMAMARLSFTQPSMGTRSTSDGVATSVNAFMGGRRGEISPDEPQIPSYLEARQFSRRGNLLPARPSTSGASARTSNTTTPPNNNSSPNPFSMNAAAGTSLTHRSAGYEISKSFDRLRTQGSHLGLAISPCFPKCKEDLVKHREERKNDAKDAMNKRIREKEEIMRLKSMEGCEGALVKIKPAFGGKVFRDGLSGVFAQKTIWGHPTLDAKLPEIVEWPTLSEVKQAGSQKMGLPIPKYKAKKGMAAEKFEYFAGDRFGFAAGDKRAAINEEEVKQHGEMKNLFEEIDG
ncbi:hypothetical protein EYC84_001538 [Monilinia fructicola]|uniref:Uncharacterized protein n=1 Tax=Monilinia fructicola TaxID=38448 RepID=A0A5M9JPV4_MONFR|nr:hypothetical protein EYC84_001538 [Monilinia fructicola]